MSSNFITIAGEKNNLPFHPQLSFDENGRPSFPEGDYVSKMPTYAKSAAQGEVDVLRHSIANLYGWAIKNTKSLYNNYFHKETSVSNGLVISSSNQEISASPQTVTSNNSTQSENVNNTSSTPPQPKEPIVLHRYNTPSQQKSPAPVENNQPIVESEVSKKSKDKFIPAEWKRITTHTGNLTADYIGHCKIVVKGTEITRNKKHIFENHFGYYKVVVEGEEITSDTKHLFVDDFGKLKLSSNSPKKELHKSVIITGSPLVQMMTEQVEQAPPLCFFDKVYQVLDDVFGTKQRIDRIIRDTDTTLLPQLMRTINTTQYNVNHLSNSVVPKIQTELTEKTNIAIKIAKEMKEELPKKVTSAVRKELSEEGVGKRLAIYVFLGIVFAGLSLYGRTTYNEALSRANDPNTKDPFQTVDMVLGLASKGVGIVGVAISSLLFIKTLLAPHTVKAQNIDSKSSPDSD